MSDASALRPLGIGEMLAMLAASALALAGVRVVQWVIFASQNSGPEAGNIAFEPFVGVSVLIVLIGLLLWCVIGGIIALPVALFFFFAGRKTTPRTWLAPIVTLVAFVPGFMLARWYGGKLVSQLFPSSDAPDWALWTVVAVPIAVSILMERALR